MDVWSDSLILWQALQNVHQKSSELVLACAWLLLRWDLLEELHNHWEEDFQKPAIGRSLQDV